jgi:alkyl sulfatase BDS1-like metallo-beta-lactamase superfamily hydrolase
VGLSKWGGVVRPLTYLIIVILTFSAIFCGADLVEEGKKAYSSGDYTQAINLLTEAQKEDSTNRSYDEILCMAYLYRGKEIYQKTRNVQAFDGNFDKASKYLPANPTIEFNKKYVQMLLSLAKVYHSAKPRNDEEKEYYHENALDRIKQAIAIDSTNSSADSMLAQLKVDYFQNLVEKGEELYKKAGRTGNADLYFTAEYYLKEALEFEPENKRINNLLNKIVQNTLPVLNYREDVSLAVAGFSRERKAIIMTLSIKNYTSEAISLNLANFKLVDREGNKYGVNEEEMKKRELFGETCIKNTVLNKNNPSASGIIAFSAPKDANLAYVNYHISNNKAAKKYFP